MVLAKSDLRIATRYAELADDPKAGKRIFALIRAEWERTQAALLDGEPVVGFQVVRSRGFDDVLDPLGPKELAALFAAEVGRQLAPADPGVRLAHAEVRLASTDGRGQAIEELRGLRAAEGGVGARATVLLEALGEGGGA